MSYIDDLVKLNYLVPMRQAANSTLSNVNTFQSKDAIKEFLDKIQTNSDGTSRPGGASQLDLTKPESIQQLLGNESGTMSKLLDISGGQMNTPEMAGIQSISDRLLKGANLASEMTSRIGTTEYQKREAGIGEGNLEVAKRKTAIEEADAPGKRTETDARATELYSQARLNNRLPKPSGASEKNTAEQQLQAEYKVSVMQSDDPILKNDKGMILKAVQLPGNTLDNMRSVVAQEYPKMPKSQQEDKVKSIINALGTGFQTAKQDALDQKNKALEQAKTLKVITYKNGLANQWESMDNAYARSKLKEVEMESAKKSGENIDDSTADERARARWMNQRLKESGDPDLMPVKTSNPLELNIKPVTKRALGTQGKW